MGRALAVLLLAGCTASNPAQTQPDLSIPGDSDLAVSDLAGVDPTVDLSVAHDLSVAGDLAATPSLDLSVSADLSSADLRSPPDLAPAVTTVHSIDVGQVMNATRVQVDGLVVIGGVRLEGTTNASMRCIYGAYAQDPTGSAPSGIRLFAIGDPCTQTDMGSCKCKQPPSVGVPLDPISGVGDVISVTGNVDIFTPVGLPAQHSIEVATLTKLGSGGSVTPLSISDGSLFAHNGSGYVTDESMLVTIHPAAPFTISTVDSFGNFTGASAQFNGYYRFFYTGPADSSTWTSITGIAQPAFGGAISARTQSDFVP